MYRRSGETKRKNRCWVRVRDIFSYHLMSLSQGPNHSPQGVVGLCQFTNWTTLWISLDGLGQTHGTQVATIAPTIDGLGQISILSSQNVINQEPQISAGVLI